MATLRALPRVERIVWWFYPDSELNEYDQPTTKQITGWWGRAEPVPAECLKTDDDGMDALPRAPTAQCPLVIQLDTVFTSTHPLAVISTNESSVCCARCVANKHGCAFFTWAQQADTCILYANITSTKPQPGAISGGGGPTPTPPSPPAPPPPPPGPCTKPAGCGAHGDCTDGRCVCQSGWGGTHCERALRENCTHGGVPSASGASCVNCSGAWSGSLCDRWDPNISPHILTAELRKIANASAAYQRSLAQLHPLPGQVGVGYDVLSGKRKLPIVSLSYNDASKTWNGYILPEEAIFTEVQVPMPVSSAMVFDTSQALANQLATWWGQQHGTW